MSKLGFVIQHPTPRINPLLRAGPSILVCVNNPGLIDSLKPLAPDALYIFRKHFDEQPLDRPKLRARMVVSMLKRTIEKEGHRYDGVELYNEIDQSKLDVAKRFRDFQLECLEKLSQYSIGVVVDNDPTWHPHFPEDWPELWEVKSEVYAHPAATWRCRHEYIPQRYYEGGYAQWGRHIKEIEWLRHNGKVVLPHYIGEWGWDKGPPVGPWSMGVTVEDWVQGVKGFRALAAPEVIGWAYFGAGLDQAWPAYNLTSRRAPRGIVQAVAEYIQTENGSNDSGGGSMDVWENVPPEIARWKELIGEITSGHHVPIPDYNGIAVSPAKVVACIIMKESSGDPDIVNPDSGATGLMQIMPFHFDAWEEPTDPEWNIKKGLSIFEEKITKAKDLYKALFWYSGKAGRPEAPFIEDYWLPFVAWYKAFWAVDLEPGGEVDYKKKYEDLRNGAVAAIRTLQAVLDA